MFVDPDQLKVVEQRMAERGYRRSRFVQHLLNRIPGELDEAAMIDGCSRSSAVVRIILPLAKGGLVATAVFIGIGAWNDYLVALMLTSSAGSRTWPVGLQAMVGVFQLPWGSLAAGGIISVVPVAILFAIFQRALVRGLTAGAVKG